MNKIAFVKVTSDAKAFLEYETDRDGVAIILEHAAKKERASDTLTGIGINVEYRDVEQPATFQSAAEIADEIDEAW